MTVMRRAIWAGSAALAILAPPPVEAAVPHASTTTRTMTAQLEPKDFGKPRPTVCTEQYEPVCGRIDGVRKTYSNRCYARADGASIAPKQPCNARAPSRKLEEPASPPSREPRPVIGPTTARARGDRRADAYDASQEPPVS